MGYNTPVLILNDQLHSLRDDPAAGRAIFDAISSAQQGERSPGRLAGQGRHGIMALAPRHADEAQVVVVAANSIRRLKGYGYWQDDDEAILRKLADAHGYRLVKK